MSVPYSLRYWSTSSTSLSASIPGGNEWRSLPAQLTNVAIELVNVGDHDLLNALVDDGLLAGKEPACVRHDHANVELPPEGAISEVILGSRLKGMSADDLDVASYLVRQPLRRHLDVSIGVAAD